LRLPASATPQLPCPRRTEISSPDKVHYNCHIATFCVAINVKPTAVIQVKPGIGDVIWHLPFIRAIAAAAPGAGVTFFAPPSSAAKELLAAEPRVATTIYFEHSGSELRRGINLIRLVALLRRQRLGSIWILDRTIRPALAAALAGIPERIGIGLGAQNLFITNPGIGQEHFHDHPIDWLRALMVEMGVPLASSEPDLPLPAATLTAIARKFEVHRRPWLVLGIGASHPDKDWPDDAWIEFLGGLQSPGTIFLIGGPANSVRAQNFIKLGQSSQAVNACALGLTEAAALLRLADLFVGPSSGPLNLAAAGGTEAFGLFGTTPILTYSKFIHAIVPDGGPSPGGMRRISPRQVLKDIAPYLSQRKIRPQHGGINLEQPAS
jgi:heptosyltransferase II